MEGRISGRLGRWSSTPDEEGQLAGDPNLQFPRESSGHIGGVDDVMNACGRLGNITWVS